MALTKWWTNRDYSNLGGPCVINGLVRLSVVDLYRVNLAKVELCFPNLPLLWSSGLAWTTRGIHSVCSWKKEVRWQLWHFCIWKVGAGCQGPLQLLRLSFVCGSPSCQEAANEPVQPFGNSSFTFPDSWPGACLSHDEGQSASARGQPHPGSCLKAARDQCAFQPSSWSPAYPQGSQFIFASSTSWPSFLPTACPANLRPQGQIQK